MQYHGKSIDTFEDAAAMLFKNHGYDVFPHADCVSLRCFAFQINKQDWKNWIVPSIDHKSAVTRLFSFCGLEAYMEFRWEKDFLWEMMECGCLVGPVSEIKPYGIYSLYYDGCRKYLYICGKKNEFYIVHDPDGFPMRLMKKEDFEKYYDLSIAGAVRLRTGGNLINRIDYLQILKDGLRYRRETENIEDINAWQWICSGEVKRSQKISVLYGLYNYLLQINKIICLVENAERFQKSEIENLNLIMKKLYRCVGLEDIEQFVKLRENLFLELEKTARLRDSEE